MSFVAKKDTDNQDNYNAVSITKGDLELYKARGNGCLTTFYSWYLYVQDGSSEHVAHV